MHLGNGEEGTQSMNTYLEMGVNVRSVFHKPQKKPEKITFTFL